MPGYFDRSGRSAIRITGAQVHLLVESGREESGVFGFATLGAKQSTGGRPVISGRTFAEDDIAFGTFTGPFDGDGAGIVFVVVHFFRDYGLLVETASSRPFRQAQ
jgi:hypothetical protein